MAGPRCWAVHRAARALSIPQAAEIVSRSPRYGTLDSARPSPLLPEIVPYQRPDLWATPCVCEGDSVAAGVLEAQIVSLY